MNGIHRHEHLLTIAFAVTVAATFHGAPGLAAQADPDDALVHLQAEGLTAGRLISWPNRGSVGGRFALDPAVMTPLVEAVAGHKAVTFSGRQWLQSTFVAPDTITGNSDYTVAVWVYNPTVEGEECLFTWSRRAGGVGAAVQLNYGAEPEFGAVSHWWAGGGDMGFDGGVPAAGQWHHIVLTFDGRVEKIYVDGALNAEEAKVLNILPRKHMQIGCADNAIFFSGSLARLAVYGRSLGAEEIKRLAADMDGGVEGALVNLSAAALPEGPIEKWPNQGSIDGVFEVVWPQVASVDGRAAVTLCGQTLNASFCAPAGITGNGDYTVAIWALNPRIDNEECMLSWTRRYGDAGVGARINFGSSWDYGAVSHFGWGHDLGFQGGLPSAGQWHHIVVRFDGKREELYVDGCLNARHTVSLNIGSGYTPSLGSVDGELFFSGALADVRIYDQALDDRTIRQLYLQGSGPVLVRWRQDLEYAEMLLGKGDGQAAATHLAKVVDECGRWIEANPRETGSSHKVLLHDACRLLAGLKLAAGAADGEIVDLMLRSNPASLDAPRGVEAVLWLNAHLSPAGAARILPLFLPADEDRFARIETMARQFETIGNWSAFERFLDALSGRQEEILALGRTAIASVRANSRWLEACYAYCRDREGWRGVACELAELLAWRCAMEDRFAEAAEFYQDRMTQSESPASRSLYALLASECLLKDGQCEKVIATLDSIATEAEATGPAPNQVRPGILRARALMRLNKFEAASGVLRELQAKGVAGGMASEILFLDGCCRLAREDLMGAAEVFRTLLEKAPEDDCAGKARLLLQYCCKDGRGPAVAAE